MHSLFEFFFMFLQIFFETYLAMLSEKNYSFWQILWRVFRTIIVPIYIILLSTALWNKPDLKHNFLSVIFESLDITNPFILCVIGICFGLALMFSFLVYRIQKDRINKAQKEAQKLEELNQKHD
jgi:ACR3 family arsenite efflux pump ArsB